MTAMRRVWPLVGALTLFACSSATPGTTVQSPVSPTSAATIARVDLGVLGSASATIGSGQTLQLFAVATDSSGAKIDVTNLATWSSANPETASVALGLVSAKAVGIVKISAVYAGASGSIETTVAAFACAKSTLTPVSRIFAVKATVPCSDDDGQYGERVTVAASDQSCHWTAQVDVPWIGIDCYSMASTSSGRGSGSFSYRPRWNNYPGVRTGHITVTFDDGARLVHTVTQEAPTCSYVVSPDQISLPRAGGSGAFQVTVTPENCQWTLDMSTFDATRVIVSARSGTGSRQIDYQVLPNTNTFLRIYDLAVNGLSGINPPGTLTIRHSQ